MPYIHATNQPLLWAVTLGGGVLAHGLTETGGATLTGEDKTLVSDASEMGFLGALPAAEFPALPASGWLEAGDIYNHEGTLVMVRQSHSRTVYPPMETPALFVVYRADENSVLDWVVGEPVEVGMLRTYEGLTYQCVLAHITQQDWTPDVTANLWREYVSSETPQPWQQPTGSQDAYNAGDRVTFEGSVWESLIDANVWSPAAYPQGWRLIGPA